MDPLFYILSILFRVPALLVAITVHEFSHGKVAEFMGDPTAKLQGRLSLNPIRHLDPLGSIMIVLVGFGWAKPVPVNAAYFKDPRRGMMYVGLAGPLANFATAILIGRVLALLAAGLPSFVVLLLQQVVMINIALGIFNLIPIPPLDGSRVAAAFLPRSVLPTYNQLENYGILILILLLTVGGRIFFTVFGPLIDFLQYLAMPSG